MCRYPNGIGWAFPNQKIGGHMNLKRTQDGLVGWEHNGVTQWFDNATKAYTYALESHYKFTHPVDVMDFKNEFWYAMNEITMKPGYYANFGILGSCIFVDQEAA